MDDIAVMAETFVMHLAANRDGSWTAAELAQLVPLHDRNLELSAYEAGFTDAHGEWVGAVILSVLEGTVPVPYYSLGTPMSVSTQAARENAHGEKLQPGEAIFVMGVGPHLGVLDDATPDGEALRGGLAALSLDEFMDNADLETLADEDARRAARSREILLSGDVRALAGNAETVDRLARSGTAGSGASSFPNWSQETLDWSSYGSTRVTTCPAGCMPLAGITLLHYWDNDYPRLIGGSAYASSHPSAVSNSKVRRGIARLQNYGWSYCSGGTTWTKEIYADDAMEEYINTWASYSFSVDNDSTSLWSKLMTSIDRGNPVLMHFGEYSGGDGHTVVTYEYTDESGTSDDWACFKVGNGTTYGCWNKSWSGWSWSRQTKVQP